MTLRKENNMSQEKLAELLGVSRQTIYKWENNKAYPDMINLVTISEIFDISMDELIKGDKKNNQIVNQIQSRKNSYEYKSGKYIGNLPLIHINIGMENCKAKGIIAIGNVSVGLISKIGRASCRERV